MLRLDPGEGRISTTRNFQAWEGGGEYNVARGLRRCFGLRTAIVTALVDNPVGRLIEDLMLQGGCDLSWLRWVEDDGVGRRARNGLNFTDRGGNRELVSLVDVLFGNEEDFSVALGFDVEGVDAHHSSLPAESFKKMIGAVRSQFSQVQVVATTLRVARSATRNDWGAIAW